MGRPWSNSLAGAVMEILLNSYAVIGIVLAVLVHARKPAWESMVERAVWSIAVFVAWPLLLVVEFLEVKPWR